MNPGDHPNPQSKEQQNTGLNLEDVYYTLFRHKWLLLAFACLGVVGVAVLPLVRPPNYVSWAKFIVLYVAENQGAKLIGPDAVIHSTDTGAQGLINSEIEILKSADVAVKVASIVGPQKILAKRGGGNDLTAAANMVMSGIEVENPRGTEVLTVSYRHRDKAVVQPVLEALIDTYMRKHWEVWLGGREMNEYYSQQSEEYRTKLAQTEEELRKAKAEAKVVSVEATKRAYLESIAKWQQDLLMAKGELAERMAMLENPGEVASATGVTSTNQVPVPLEKIDDYSAIISDLDAAKKHEHELLIHYTEAYPLVQTVKAQIEKFKRQKADLEGEFPRSPGSEQVPPTAGQTPLGGTWQAISRPSAGSPQGSTTSAQSSAISRRKLPWSWRSSRR